MANDPTKSLATYKKVSHFSSFDMSIHVSSCVYLLAAFLLSLRITHFFLMDKRNVTKYCKENIICR